MTIMKHILLFGALFLFGATVSAQSTCTGDKAKTECTKGKSSSCCAGKADAAKSCCSAKSSCTNDTKGKKDKKAKTGKDQGKENMSMNRPEEKMESTDKKAKVGPAKGDL